MSRRVILGKAQKKPPSIAGAKTTHRIAWDSPEGMWARKLTIPDELLDADTSGNWNVCQEQLAPPR
jgi:hypothetical protein